MTSPKCDLCESSEPALVLLTVLMGKQQALVCDACVLAMRGSGKKVAETVTVVPSGRKAVGK